MLLVGFVTNFPESGDHPIALEKLYQAYDRLVYRCIIRKVNSASLRIRESRFTRKCNGFSTTFATDNIYPCCIVCAPKIWSLTSQIMPLVKCRLLPDPKKKSLHPSTYALKSYRYPVGYRYPLLKLPSSSYPPSTDALNSCPIVAT